MTTWPSPSEGDLAELFVALRRGDQSVTTELCAAFGTRLYDYCHLLRGGPGPAMDAVAATFAAATAHAERLHEAERLRAWLYAIARNICTQTPPGPSTPAGEDPPALPGGDEGRMGWAAMQALEGLPPREREVLRLSLVHGLETHEIAAILDLPLEQAAALAARTRTEFEDGVAAEMVARHGRDACPVLAGLADESATADTAPAALRRRVAKHIAGCPGCAGTRLRLAPPESAAGLLPVHVPPESLYERAVATATRDETGAEADDEARAARSRGAGRRLVLAVAATVVILAAPLLLWTGGRDAGGMIGQPGIRQNGGGLGFLPGAGSPGLSPSATPTTASPTPSTTASTSTPRPGRSAPPPGSPSGPSPTRPTDPGSPTRDPGDSFEEERPADGTLAVSPNSVTLDDGQGTVQLSAQGGDVQWTGSGTADVSPSSTGGVVRSGRSVQIGVSLHTDAPETGTATLTFAERSGGSTTVAVNW